MDKLYKYIFLLSEMNRSWIHSIQPMRIRSRSPPAALINLFSGLQISPMDHSRIKEMYCNISTFSLVTSSLFSCHKHFNFDEANCLPLSSHHKIATACFHMLIYNRCCFRIVHSIPCGHREWGKGKLLRARQ